MPMYNMLEYSDNYEDSSGSLWQFKRDEQDITAAGIPNAPNATVELENAKIVVPLKYLSNFFRSLETPVINCKIYLELNWTKNCVMSSVAGITAFQITSTKLYVPIVTYQLKIM